MYEAYYQLRAKPFQLSPDPRFFFNSQGHKRALAYLRYGVRQGEGFIVITGNVGTGKTTLVTTLFKSLEKENVVAAQVVTTQLEADDLLRMVSAAYGLPYEEISKASLLRNLEAFFRACVQEGKRALLVVDEAQNLPRQAIEELRMLSNFQMGGRGLLQSFLLGQKEFKTTMRSEGFEQLRQRVIAAYHLSPLSSEETRGYVEHRLLTAGWQGDPNFSEDAYQGIHEFTGGVPRRINTLCDRLMLYGSLEEIHEISGETVNSVTRDIIEEQGSPGGDVPAISGHFDAAKLGYRGTTHDSRPAGAVPHLPMTDSDGTHSQRDPQSSLTRLTAVEQSMAALTRVLREEMFELRSTLSSGQQPGLTRAPDAPLATQSSTPAVDEESEQWESGSTDAGEPEHDDGEYFREELAVLRKALLRNTRRDVETED